MDSHSASSHFKYWLWKIENVKKKIEVKISERWEGGHKIWTDVLSQLAAVQKRLPSLLFLWKQLTKPLRICMLRKICYVLDGPEHGIFSNVTAKSSTYCLEQCVYGKYWLLRPRLTEIKQFPSLTKKTKHIYTPGVFFPHFSFFKIKKCKEIRLYKISLVWASAQKLLW